MPGVESRDEGDESEQQEMKLQKQGDIRVNPIKRF